MSHKLRSNKLRALLLLLVTFSLLAAACGSDDDGDSTADGSATEDSSTEDSATGDDAADGASADQDISAEDRCQNNQDYGTVTFVTGFDFAAAAGIVEIIAADAEGYFEELCIDVDIQPGFAPSNGALVIEGQAEMGMAGSFAELVNNNVAGEGDLVAVLHWGRTAIEAIVVPEESEISSFADLCGSLVGIKGDLPPSLQASVALAGIERGCFEETLLDGFDPVQHLELGIDALPVYKSNEPNSLTKAGISYTLLDPLDFDVPASFGVTFASGSFLAENPLLAEDVVRALIKGYEFAANDPDAAVAHAFELIDAAGNPLFLAQEAELFRWNTEAGLIASLAPDDIGIGVPDTDLFGAEIDALVSAGVFTDAPAWEPMVNRDIAADLYDGTTLIWPGR